MLLGAKEQVRPWGRPEHDSEIEAEEVPGCETAVMLVWLVPPDDTVSVEGEVASVTAGAGLELEPHCGLKEIIDDR
jgi:hypothetical protein